MEPAVTDEGVQSQWNLPVFLTSLVGREDEVVSISNRLLDDDCRLLTLLGPGGIGKTRLALAVAKALQVQNRIEVCFVNLTPVTSAESVFQTIAETIGADDGEEPGLGSLVTVFGQRQPLLVLDNLEQIADVAHPVEALLRACPGLTILATSRIPLRLSFEQRWPVSPLAITNESQIADGSRSPAAMLFEQRAKLVNPSFRLNAQTSEDVDAICTHLDGMPLAIELAAARLSSLSVKALSARLANRLVVLASDNLDVPDRQKTMESAIRWSYQLLTPDQRHLLRALSVFVGSFSSEAVQFIDGGCAAERLTALVESSLVAPFGGDRFRLFESIREYSHLRLEEEAETSEAREKLVAWAMEFTRTRGEIPSGDEMPVWIAELATEDGNLIAAIDYLIEIGDFNRLFDMIVSRGPLWWVGNRTRASRTWIERALEHGDQVGPLQRGRAMRLLGYVNYQLGDLDSARAQLGAASTLLAEVKDYAWLARAESALAEIAFLEGDIDEALKLIERSSKHNDLGGDHQGAIDASIQQSRFLTERGDLLEAEALLLAAIKQARKSGYSWTLGSGVLCLAHTHTRLNRNDQAISELHEALSLFVDLGDPWGQTTSLLLLAKALAETRPDEALVYGAKAATLAQEFDNPLLMSEVFIAQGVAALGKADPAMASAYMRDALIASQTIGVPAAIAEALSWIAVAGEAAGWSGSPSLLGYVDAFQEREPGDSTASDSNQIAALRVRVANDPAYAIGRELTEDQAIALGLSLHPGENAVSQSINNRKASGIQQADGLPETIVIGNGESLTAREVDVLRLLAGGKTNAEIGEALFISPLTAKTHVANLLGKLMVENRAAAAVWAVHHKVI